MSLLPAQKAYLKHLAAAGDIMAMQLISTDASIATTGRAGLVALGSPAAKSATSIHAALIGSVGRARLLLTAGSGDTTVTAVTGGAAANALTITMTGDATPTVRITRVGNDFTILYNTTVSTMTQVTTAINALAGADKLIEVVTANLGTGATVLSAPGSDIAKTNLASGSDTGNTFPGPITQPDFPRNLRVTVAANWDAGNITVNGTSQFDIAQSEVFVGTVGVKVGLKIFKTVTSITKASYGTHLTANASVGDGDLLGVAHDIQDAVGIGYVAGVGEAVTVDPVLDTVTFTTAPNGTVRSALLNF